MKKRKNIILSKTFGFLTEKQRIFQMKDHLLIASSNMITENYRRIFFNDLQMIQVYKTKRGVVYNIISGCLLFFFIFCFNLSWKIFPLQVFCGVSGLAVLIILIVNSIMGPTSKCFVKTKNSSEYLKLTGRLKTTEALLRKIHDPMVDVHGDFSQDELLQRLKDGKA